MEGLMVDTFIFSDHIDNFLFPQVKLVTSHYACSQI